MGPSYPVRPREVGGDRIGHLWKLLINTTAPRSSLSRFFPLLGFPPHLFLLSHLPLLLFCTLMACFSNFPPQGTPNSLSGHRVSPADYKGGVISFLSLKISGLSCHIYLNFQGVGGGNASNHLPKSKCKARLHWTDALGEWTSVFWATREHSLEAPKGLSGPSETRRAPTRIEHLMTSCSVEDSG